MQGPKGTVAPTGKRGEGSAHGRRLVKCHMEGSYRRNLRSCGSFSLPCCYSAQKKLPSVPKTLHPPPFFLRDNPTMISLFLYCEVGGTNLMENSLGGSWPMTTRSLLDLLTSKNTLPTEFLVCRPDGCLLAFSPYRIRVKNVRLKSGVSLLVCYPPLDGVQGKPWECFKGEGAVVNGRASFPSFPSSLASSGAIWNWAIHTSSQ